MIVAVISSKKNKGNSEDNYASEGMTVGMCIGVALGTSAFDNVGICISLGTLLGLAVGSSIKK